MLNKFFACAATAVLLSACGAPQPNHRPATTPDTVDLKPDAAPVVAVVREVPKITAAELLGKDEHWVQNKMGKPVFVRSEKTAHIWQYKNHRCVLNLFLYAEDSPVHRVLHFDARDTTGANTDRKACLAALQD